MPPPLPFPFPLRIGTDICRVGRIGRILRSRQCTRFIQRVLAPEELARAKPALRQVLEAAANNAARTTAAEISLKEPRGLRGGPAWQTRGKQAGEPRTDKEEEEEEEELSEELSEADREVYKRAATHLAGRWGSAKQEKGSKFAAKEAAFKAHPHLRLGFHDILILAASEAQELTGDLVLNSWSNAAPVALIRATNGGAARDQMARVSISHDGDYATAMCIGFEAGHEPKKGWFSSLSRLWS
ncbi:hypothetical protein C8A00DRAFT_31733 [Chaetomidium leptoderma]|uniref:4'-phosphopantetheinyl transferase domain-containing protein n=1 Tax=Chaetomidium leptoderma TaxID=669021 RepID=A0AAN6VSA0_9PEZI|nr:hypothetical protein C8A00DRAFT_31733 [Chaetomidium leptoderma]